MELVGNSPSDLKITSSGPSTVLRLGVGFLYHPLYFPELQTYNIFGSFYTVMSLTPNHIRSPKYFIYFISVVYNFTQYVQDSAKYNNINRPLIYNLQFPLSQLSFALYSILHLPTEEKHTKTSTKECTISCTSTDETKPGTSFVTIYQVNISIVSQELVGS